nr:nuclear transport factor 2 family protein [Sphingomonas sp. Y57]
MSGVAHCHQDIAQVIYRYARGLDRLDAALLRSCYHDEAFDSRPPIFEGTADAFVDWVMPFMRGLELSTHLIGNILIEPDGDVAGVESYFTAHLRARTAEGLTETVRSGRYIDRFERRGGRWAIARRMAVTDWSRSQRLDEAAVSLTLPGASAGVQHPVTRDRDDISYGVLGRTPS